MAGEPKYTMLLIGLGFREFSMSSAYMYQIKRIIRSVSVEECAGLVERLLEMEVTEDIENHLRDVMNDKFPWLTI
jgi:phosphotransferase system enzyme I (PtsI)